MPQSVPPTLYSTNRCSQSGDLIDRAAPAAMRRSGQADAPLSKEGACPVTLTKRQREIFDFIRGYLQKHGYPPTVRDIGTAVGLASSSTVHTHLANLERLGLLRRDPTKPRAIELLDRA